MFAQCAARFFFRQIQNSIAVLDGRHLRNQC
jgi:hypothetical protein